MIEAGVDALDRYRGSFPDELIVEAVYNAMHDAASAQGS
jgi:hypothetical protein